MELLRSSATRCRWCPAFYYCLLRLVLYSLGAKGGRVGPKIFSTWSSCGDKTLKPTSYFFGASGRWLGAFILIAPGLGLLEAPHILGGLLTSSSSERRTPSPCDCYFGVVFFPAVGHRCSCAVSITIIRPADSMLQSEVFLR